MSDTSSYPGAIDSDLVEQVPAGTTPSTFSDWAKRSSDAHEKMQTELGTNPSGAAATVAARIAAAETSVSDHLADTADAHDASAISFAPAGTVAATTVQTAIEEVASEAGLVTVKDADESYTRRGIRFVAGANATVEIADDAGEDEVEVTITATGGGGSGVAVKDEDESYTRAGIRFVPGTNVTIEIADDVAEDEVEVTISSTAAASAAGWRLATAPVERHGTGDFTTTSTSFTTITHAANADLIDFVNVPDLEVGDIVRCTLKGQLTQGTANLISIDFEVDRPTSANINVGDGHDQGVACWSGTGRLPLVAQAEFTVTEAGTHGFRPVWKISAGTATLANAASGNSDTPIIFTVEVHPGP